MAACSRRTPSSRTSSTSRHPASSFSTRPHTHRRDVTKILRRSNQRQGKQSKALFSSIAASATTLLETGDLPHELLGAVHHKHCALNVLPEQYDVVGEHILGTIVDLLDPGQEVLDAWGALYGGLAGACIGRSEELYAAMEAKQGGWRGTRGFRVARKTPLSATVCEFVPRRRGSCQYAVAATTS